MKPASDSRPARFLEGLELVKVSFLRRRGSFGGRSKITHTPTSGRFQAQPLCRNYPQVAESHNCIDGRED